MKKLKGYETSVLVAALYALFFGIIIKIAYENGWLISKDAVTGSNVWRDLLVSAAVMFPIPVVLLIIYRKRPECLGIRKSKLTVMLFGMYVLFFFLHGNWETAGIYRFFYILFFVAIPEEVIYRGYLYLQLKKWNKTGAIIISGLFFGMMHAILPGIVNDKSVNQMIVSMLNEATGGIASGGIFIIYYELSGSLLVPIMVHALLDYSFKSYGVVIAAAIMLLLIMRRKKEKIVKQSIKSK